jgi:hypothetical protein
MMKGRTGKHVEDKDSFDPSDRDACALILRLTRPSPRCPSGFPVLSDGRGTGFAVTIHALSVYFYSDIRTA